VNAVAGDVEADTHVDAQPEARGDAERGDELEVAIIGADIPGLERFAGEALLTAAWNHDGKLEGRASIGSARGRTSPS